MLNRNLLIGVLTVVVLVLAGLSAHAQFTIGKVMFCREDGPGAQRHDGLVAVARALADQEAVAVNTTAVYQRIDRLTNLPTIPEGFAVRLYADATGYVLSIVDTEDPCHYALFSDERGWLYDGRASEPQLALARQ
jgi:hypothetical protein